eukprot:Skav229217  [mRNA]  locus=scaffold2439:124437:126125:- [translate_table: standard]
MISSNSWSFLSMEAAKGRSLERYFSRTPRTVSAAAWWLAKPSNIFCTTSGALDSMQKPSNKARRSCSGSTGSSSVAPKVNSPSKGEIFFTLEGSFNSNLAKSSPADTMLPAARAWLTLPASGDFNAIIIFMASSSTKVSPLAISVPSSCK